MFTALLVSNFFSVKFVENVIVHFLFYIIFTRACHCELCQKWGSWRTECEQRFVILVCLTDTVVNYFS